MKFKYNLNIIKLIELKYLAAGTMVSIDNFKFLRLEFTEPAYPILYSGGGIWVKAEQPRGTYFLGHIFKMNGQTYVVNECGVYMLEDSNGFEVLSLYIPYEEDVLLTFQVDINVRSRTSITGSTFDLPVDENKYDYITQEKRVIAPDENLFISNRVTITSGDKTYKLASIDIEIDSGAVFDTLGNGELIIGDTERLTVPYISDFNTLTYKGIYLSESTTWVTASKEVLITYYYREEG